MGKIHCLVGREPQFADTRAFANLQACGGVEVPLPAHVPEVKARPDTRSDKSPAIRAERGRAKVVRGELDPGYKAHVGRSQRGRGLRAEFDQVTKESPYFAVLPPDAKPPLDLNKEIMARFRPEMSKSYLHVTPRLN